MYEPTTQTTRLPRTHNRLRSVLAMTIALAVLSVAGWSLSALARQAPAPAPLATSAPVHAAPPLAAVDRTIGASKDSYADVVAEVAPAVVTVRADRRVRQAEQFPFTNDPFFRRFFGDRFRDLPQEPQERNALGSGVIVREDGFIITNHHVVDGADQIKVELTDRRTFDAKLVGSDAPSDLAVLKISATGLHSLALGDTDRVRVGDIVLAVGNPLGVGQTVTMGIVSGKGRATGLSDGSFEDFIQTDAPINQGNSGGALVNTRGELVGINSQILSPSGGNIGIGFAIPATMADNVLDQLVRDGRVRRGLLGVTVQPVTSDLATTLGLSEVRGALVNSVQGDSPAARAGIERGDVILTFNGQPVSDSNGLRNQVARTPPQSKVTLQIVRDRREQTLTATLAELPTGRAVTSAPSTTQDGGRFGLTVDPLTPELADRLGLRGSSGLVVREVAPASPASEAGIRSGDVIRQVNRRPVDSVAALQNALRATGDQPTLMLLNRAGADFFVALAPKRG
jgi:serine protease Do